MSKISWHCPFKLPFACTKLYKVKTANSRCHSLPIGNYIPWLWIYLKVPPPPNTQTPKLCKYILRAGGGGISHAIRKCSPLAQVRREQKKPGPLLLVYFMGTREHIFSSNCSKRKIHMISTLKSYDSMKRYWKTTGNLRFSVLLAESSSWA